VRLFTSEAVTEGHPDKVCDQISDGVLDAILSSDKMARVACEVAVTTGLVLVIGEITTTAYVDIQKIARDTIREIGYDRAKYGFDGDNCAVLVSIDEQSPDIAMGVNKSFEAKKNIDNDGFNTGAGDQGMMFGFACNETETLMPMPAYLSQKLAKELSNVRKSGKLNYLRPDGKTQVTVKYDDNGQVAGIDTIVISTQHCPDVTQQQIAADLRKYVIDNIIPAEMIDNNTKIHVNPTGQFIVGGPAGDSGLTGRKIIVDTYGGYARHGGGAFSGKDPTKVDRSAAYAARQIAKSVVANSLADMCEVQIAYAIGVAHPVSIRVDTFGTEKIPVPDIEKLIKSKFDMRPDAIIERLDLRRPIYKPVSVYGNFGRDDLDLSWEKVVEF